jgi:hypothetical protein
MTRTFEQFMELPYSVLVVHDVDEDGNQGWVAEVVKQTSDAHN